jgi:hypothetical protein
MPSPAGMTRDFWIRTAERLAQPVRCAMTAVIRRN